MAADTRINAVHGINRYLYFKGKERSIFLDQGIYGGRTAFAPVKEITSFSKMTMSDGRGGLRSVPYIVFTWTTPRIGTDWFIQSEQITYLIYSTELDEIRTITNFIIDSMKQYDRSAINVQTWLEKQPPSVEVNGQMVNPYEALEIHTISVDSASSPTPIDQAGGRMEAIVTLDVQYGVLRDSQATTDEYI
jgi:hypothetical protein